MAALTAGDASPATAPHEGWPAVGPDPSDPTTRHPSPTLVVVEHVLGPWVDLVDRLVVLSVDGRVVADGPVRTTLHDRARPPARDGHLGAGRRVRPTPVAVDRGPA